MELFIVILATLIIWLISIFMLCVIISFAKYAKQEVIHSFNNAKRSTKQMLIDLAWAYKHRR